MSLLDLILFVPRKLRALLFRFTLGMKMAFSKKSYLVKTGFIHSRISDSLRNKNGEYLPWMNYSIIQLFNERLSKTLMVFEYGSGSSTMYFAKRVGHIMSVEYNEGWFKKVVEHTQGMDNVDINFVPLDDNYHKAVGILGHGKKFDIIIVDGRYRVESALFSFDYLSEKGVVILDDSARPHYSGAFDFYHEKGFHHLTFQGLKPTGFGVDTTTIFYRSGANCLGL